jgi:hypothetical protein
MSIGDKLSGISRRDLMRLSGRFGMSSVLLAAGSMGGGITLASLAKAAESTYDKRFRQGAQAHAEIRRRRLQPSATC